MTESFMPDLPLEQRRILLRDNADSVDETTYMKDLSDDDLDSKREQLVSNLEKISSHDEELDAAKEAHKAATKPLKLENKVLLTEVRHRKTEVKGTLYSIADRERGMMVVYDDQGDFVSSRRLRPDEKSRLPFPMRKAANDE
jgi:hypothetical protein